MEDAPKRIRSLQCACPAINYDIICCKHCCCCWSFVRSLACNMYPVLCIRLPCCRDKLLFSRISLWLRFYIPSKATKTAQTDEEKQRERQRNEREQQNAINEAQLIKVGDLMGNGKLPKRKKCSIVTGMCWMNRVLSPRDPARGISWGARLNSREQARAEVLNHPPANKGNF